MKLLIDADIVVYRGGYAAERTSYLLFAKGDEEMGHVASFRYMKDVNGWIDFWGHSKDDFTIEKKKEIQPLSNALQNVRTIVQGILNAMGSNDYTLYLTSNDKSNFRYDVAITHPYKGNRKEKPHWYNEIREYLINEWDAVVVEGMEADDALGIEQYAQMADEGIPENHHTSCICTIDKDLDMIPGYHYNFVKKEKYWVTEEEGIKNFYIQLLTGDTTDNIIGLKGVGPVGAKKILAECDTEFDMYYACCMAYKEKDLPHERLVENANLLWIRREEGIEWSKPS